jgi:hypothetical protein
MALRYYPLSRIKMNLITNGTQFTLDGKPYSGKYYETFDGKFYSGPNPALGKNQELNRIGDYSQFPALASKLPITFRDQLVRDTGISNLVYSQNKRPQQKPTSYYPKPLDADYRKGYITRYFCKKVNDKGYVIEISPEEWANIKNGTVDYDVSFYLTGELFWKISGPLNTVRLSQYDIRMGIIDNNRAKTEELNKTFLGILDFIGGDYSQFAISTK